MKKLSVIISRIFDPLRLVGPVTFSIVLFNVGLNSQQLKVLLPILLTLNVILPLLVFLFLKKTGIIEDTDISKRQQRYLFFICLSIIFLVSSIVIWFLGNRILFVLSLVLFTLTTTVWLINFKSKISGHMAWDTLAAFVLNYLFGWKLLWLFFLLPVIAYARVDLKKHTVLQVIVGTIIGIAEPLLIFKFFALI